MRVVIQKIKKGISYYIKMLDYPTNTTVQYIRHHLLRDHRLNHISHLHSFQICFPKQNPAMPRLAYQSAKENILQTLSARQIRRY